MSDLWDTYQRLEEAIEREREAMAREAWLMIDANRVQEHIAYRVSHDNAHLHRYALKILLIVRDGKLPEPLKLPCENEPCGYGDECLLTVPEAAI